MKFVHFADCHIDGFKDPRLSKLGNNNFKFVIDFSLEKEVDFILLAGDLFNTALPRIDALKFVTEQLKLLQDADIPVYIIPGSHDYSPHGRTMLDVLELAGLVVNVAKGIINEKGNLELQFTKDPKTEVLITGILGRAGMLDKMQYKIIDKTKIPDGKKIFMFHTSIQELKTPKLEQMEASPIDILPSGFDYYAGGHVHIVNKFSNEMYANVVYPGPTFPNNFSELEDLKQGSFVYFENDSFEHKFIPGKKVITLVIDCNDLSYEEVHDKTMVLIEKSSIDNAVVLLRFFGIIEGKSANIDFKTLIQTCYDDGAYVVLRNTNKLQSKLFEEIANTNKASKDIEEDTIREHLDQIVFNGDERIAIEELLKKLDTEILDGEKKTTFQERVVDTSKHVLEN